MTPPFNVSESEFRRVREQTARTTGRLECPHRSQPAKAEDKGRIAGGSELEPEELDIQELFSEAGSDRRDPTLSIFAAGAVGDGRDRAPSFR